MTEACAAVTFTSTGSDWRLDLGDSVINDIVGACAEAKGAETGGVLVGYYSEDGLTAVVLDIIAAPPGSQGSRRMFIRGTEGLLEELHRRWMAVEQSYYIGEWHSHPNGPMLPSKMDVDSMYEIANAPKAHCPEVVLLLIGGECRDAGDMAARVFTRRGKQIELRQA